MKFYLLIAITLLFSAKLEAKEKIGKSKITYELPNGYWNKSQKLKNHGVHAKIYKRDPLIDSKKVRVIPNIAFICQKVENSTDIEEFAENRHDLENTLENEESFTHENGPLNFKNAIGFKGNYTSKDQNHTVYLVYLINNGHGVTIVCDVTTELFEEVKDEFDSLLLSIQ